MLNASTVYAPKPWDSLPEQRAGLALMRALLTDPTQVRPPIPNIGKTPSRFGMRHRYPTIGDVIDINSTYPGGRVDYSQRVSGYGGTSFPALGVI